MYRRCAFMKPDMPPPPLARPPHSGKTKKGGVGVERIDICCRTIAVTASHPLRWMTGWRWFQQKIRYGVIVDNHFWGPFCAILAIVLRNIVPNHALHLRSGRGAKILEVG